MLVHLAEHKLPDIFGVRQESAGPAAELRVLFEDAGHPMAARLPDAIYLEGCYQALTKTADDTETILYADWHYTHRAVLTYRRAGEGRTACTSLQAYSDPKLQSILYRLLRQLAGHRTSESSIGVGILGYAPSVGQTHGLGTEKTPGLILHAICDINPDRLHQARKDFPRVKTYESAAERGVHLSCHQNRRWDPDYLAIKQSVTEGLIGECFYIETFVGRFHHPCGYWHSHAAVSGGTSYDWGAHYLDWIVSLIPEPIETVLGTRHKRVWHDVTNADQERIQSR